MIHISFRDVTNMADFWGKLTPNPIEVNGNRMEFCRYFLTFPKNRYLNHLNTFPEHILTKFDRNRTLLKCLIYHFLNHFSVIFSIFHLKMNNYDKLMDKNHNF